MNKSIQLYIWLLPFVSAFALAPALPLPVIGGCIIWLAVLNNIFTRPVPVKYFMDNSLILGVFFLLCVWVSYLYNGWGVPKSTNHVIAYTSSILLFFIGPGLAFTYIRPSDASKIIFRCIFYTTLLAAFFAVLEFLLKNMGVADINSLIPRPAVQEFDALALSEFFRARGFAEESGHFALFLEVLSPLCFYYLFFSNSCFLPGYLKVICSLIIFLSWIFVISPASFVLVPLSYLASFFFFFQKIHLKGMYQRLAIVGLSLLSLLFLLNLLYPVTDFFYLSVIEKLDSTSSEDRQVRIDFFFEYFQRGDVFNWFLGNGPAAFDILGFDDSKSILSLYYSILFEVGVLGFLILCCLFISVLVKITRLQPRQGFFVMASFISAAIHYYFVANYWFPWLWFLFALVIYLSKMSTAAPVISNGRQKD